MEVWKIEKHTLNEDGTRDLKEIVGENVHRYRLEAGLKRTTFCRLICYQGSNLKRLEEGGMNIGLDKLQEIASVLGITVIDLVEDWSE